MPDDIEHDMAHSLERAEATFVAFTGEGKDNEDVFTVFGDMLADLRHLADHWDLDWDNLLRIAYMHYDAEKEENPCKKE